MKNKERLDIEEAHSHHIVGGMYSAHGCGSFRGKCYSRIVESVTGQSLYEEINAETIKEMAIKLEDAEYQDSWKDNFGVTREAWDAIVKMFRVYANGGASLHAWH